VEIINRTSNTTISNKSTARIIFNATTNDNIYGHRNITGFDEVTVQNGKFYRIRYLADPEDYGKYKRVIENMISSLELLDGNNSRPQNEPNLSYKANTINSTSSSSSKNPSSVEANKIDIRTYIGKGIEIKYPSKWGKIDGYDSLVIFYSPINFYLIGTGYIVLIDVPSTYETSTDFVAKVMWWHRLFDRKWFKIIEEVSSGGQSRTLEQDPDFKEFFKKRGNWEAYAFIPINLRIINSQNQYLMVFVSEATYVRNDLLCELVQKTDQVSNPPPKLSISISPNSTSLGPGEIKSVEVKVTSFSDIPYNVSFQKPVNGQIEARFNPPAIEIPPSGWNTTQLTIKSNWKDWKVPWNSPSVVQTLGLLVNASHPQREKGNFLSFNTNLLLSKGAAQSEIDRPGLTITAFNWPDDIRNFLTSWEAAVSVLVTLLGLIGAFIAWILKRYTNKLGDKNKNNNAINHHQSS
jgi:hypothetical protein